MSCLYSRLPWLFCCFIASTLALASINTIPHSNHAILTIAVVGLTHDHVHWILGREAGADVQMVAIVEPNRALAQRYANRYGYSMDIVYPSLEAMYKHVQPEAVTAFNPIFDHLEVVEFCAPRGIHVMVEKPMAVSLEHANRMLALAEVHGIHLLTNYETTWYDSHWESYDMIHKDYSIGDIRRVIFYTGHRGPREIGCSEEFLEWLTDPVLNGAGALTDFGCYGANLSTWLMQGKTPHSISCIAKTYKPSTYPKVDDDATIILNYDDVEVIIQASWNWPYSRKEMSVYGTIGAIHCKNKTDMLTHTDNAGEKSHRASTSIMGSKDPFTYLYEVIKKGVQEPPFNLSSVENNAIVVKILEGAKMASASGKTILWSEIE